MTNTLHLPAPLALHHGGSLPNARIAFRLYGDLARPLVVVLGGISAGRHVTSCDQEPHAGWWQAMVGGGRAIDPGAVCVLGLDYLGGFGGSSGPAHAGDAPFPHVSTHDQAAALAHVLDHLGVARAHAVVGASYGGMVTLAFAERHGARVDRVVVLSAPHRSHPMATAFRSVQRQIVRLGIESNRGHDALATARALAMITYRAPEEFAARFDADPTWTADGPCFAVEPYLAHCGATFADRCPPESFLTLSTSVDLHRVDPAGIHVPTTLVAVDSDLLVPPAQLRELRDTLAGPAVLHEITSPYGHDAFLKEVPTVGAIVHAALGR